MKMKGQLLVKVQVAHRLAESLYTLLREDSVRRLRLHATYGTETDTQWTPDFQRRIELSEALCRRLESVIESLGGIASATAASPADPHRAHKRAAGGQ